MTSLAALRKRLKRANINQIARLARVAPLTVRRVRDETNKPNMDTYERLEAALRGVSAPPKKARA